jgi:2-dehydro-3-deoxyphosphogluconate aldolase/(4S)-4-hydroxy-2-oxoglutarate aldolase
MCERGLKKIYRAEYRIVDKLIDTGIIAIVRTDSPDKAERIAEACLAGGLHSIEITFSVPRADRVIAALRERFSPAELLLGAGTVLDAETARIAHLSGASYIISPFFCPETAALCNLYKIPYIPGCMTVREIAQALKAGAELVKLFPASAFTPEIIKAIHGPLPQAALVPTGGINLHNAGEWIRAGAAAVAVGGSLTAGEDYGLIGKQCRTYLEIIKVARREINAKR